MLTIPAPRPGRHLAALALLAVMPLVAACGGGGGTTGTETPTVQPTLVPAETDVATHQVTSAKVRGARLTAASYSGTLGTASLTAGRTSDSTLAFVVPALPAGEHRASFAIGGSTVTATLRVAVTPDVADPVAYVGGIASQFAATNVATQATVARAAGGMVSINQAGFALDIAKAQASLDSAQIVFAAMTPAEQQEVAKLLRASFGAAGAGLSRGAGASLNVVPGPAYCEAPLFLTVEQTEICSAAAAQELLTTEVDACDAEAAEAASRGFSARNRNFLWHLFNGCHYAQLTKWSADSWEAVQWPTMPDLDELVVEEIFESRAAVSSAAPGASASLSAAEPIGFFPAVPRTLGPKVRFRPMIASDVGKVPAATQTSQLLATLAAKWTKLNSFIGGLLGQAPATLAGSSGTSRAMPYSASRLRLGSISPATVRGSATVTNGRWALTFDTDDKTKSTPFTFDVIYNGGTYGSDTARVAGVIVLDSIALYRAASAGLWTVTDFHSGVVNQLELRADGNAYEAGRFVGGWSIEKGPYAHYYPESRYYLRVFHLSRGTGDPSELVIGAVSMPVREMRNHMNNGDSPHHYVKN